MVRKQSLQVELARKDRYPDFSVQYQWQHTAEQFRDYYMLTFSARLPIYRKRKLDPEMTQAVEELDQSRREYDSHVQQAYFDVRDQYICGRNRVADAEDLSRGSDPSGDGTFRAGLGCVSGGQARISSPCCLRLSMSCISMKSTGRRWPTMRRRWPGSSN